MAWVLHTVKMECRYMFAGAKHRIPDANLIGLTGSMFFGEDVAGKDNMAGLQGQVQTF